MNARHASFFFQGGERTHTLASRLSANHAILSLGGLRREANSQTPVAISIPAAVSESATLTPAEQRFLSYLAPHMGRNWRSFLSVYS